MTSGEQTGRDMGASSGSREPGLASRPGPPGFDPARKPRRAHVLKVEFGANTQEDLIYALNQMAIDIRLGTVATKGCSGSPSVGFTYEYDVDESWTKARYFAAIDEHLAAEPSNTSQSVGGEDK